MVLYEVLRWIPYDQNERREQEPAKKLDFSWLIRETGEEIGKKK